MDAAGPARSSDGTVAWRWGRPRYELRLVLDDAVHAPLLVWSRHRTRTLAAYSLRVERATHSFGEARLALVDRRTQQELHT